MGQPWAKLHNRFAVKSVFPLPDFSETRGWTFLPTCLGRAEITQAASQAR